MNSDAPQLPGDRQAYAHLTSLRLSSRDVASLNLDAEKTPEALNTAVRKLFTIATKQTQALEQAAAYEGKHLACKNGCWFCCTQIVMATLPEILRIADHIRETWSDEERAELQVRIAKYKEATAAYRDDPTKPKPRLVCPLLRDQSCSVWTTRPFACMGWNSFDVEACIRKKDDPVNDPPIPKMDGQLLITFAVRNGLREALQAKKLDYDYCDLILGLDTALAHQDATARYLAGEPIFADAVAATPLVDDDYLKPPSKLGANR